MHPNPLRSASARVALVFVTLALSGCVCSNYQRVKKPAPPSVLNATVELTDASAVVNSVIIIRGPGSWKRNAYWDEYVVTVTNRTGAPLAIERATLVGLANSPYEPGSNPWALEKQSRTLADRNFGLLGNAAVQVGSGATAIALGGTAGLMASGGAGAGCAGYGAGAIGGAAVGVLVAIPVFVGGSVYRNITHKHAIEAEFQRRRLALPAVVGPGTQRQGSFFFPITPGPRVLDLELTTPSGPTHLAINLTPLADLHLKTR